MVGREGKKLGHGGGLVVWLLPIHTLFISTPRFYFSSLPDIKWDTCKGVVASKSEGWVNASQNHFLWIVSDQRKVFKILGKLRKYWKFHVQKLLSLSVRRLSKLLSDPSFLHCIPWYYLFWPNVERCFRDK